MILSTAKTKSAARFNAGFFFKIYEIRYYFTRGHVLSRYRRCVTTGDNQPHARLTFRLIYHACSYSLGLTAHPVICWCLLLCRLLLVLVVGHVQQATAPQIRPSLGGVVTHLRHRYVTPGHMVWGRQVRRLWPPPELHVHLRRRQTTFLPIFHLGCTSIHQRLLFPLLFFPWLPPPRTYLFILICPLLSSF